MCVLLLGWDQQVNTQSGQPLSPAVKNTEWAEYAVPISSRLEMTCRRDMASECVGRPSEERGDGFSQIPYLKEHRPKQSCKPV